MTPNHVKQRLRAGRPAFGTLLHLADPLAAEMMASVGFDWLLVDTEHGPIDLATLATMFATITRYPVAPLVRVHALAEENAPHPEFEDAMRTVLAAARRHSVAAGIHCQSAATVNRRIAEGWTLVGMVNDHRFLMAGAKAARDAVTT